jgi:predicted metalloprotease with PDZ domain
MRMHTGIRAAVLTLSLSLAAAVAFAGDGPAASAGPPIPAAPAGPAVPPAPAFPAAPAVPSPPDIDQAALQARLDAARRRLEAAAQQMAALSAQMYRPMMRRFGVFAGPPHGLIGVQLGRSRGEAGASVREVSPGGPAQRAGVRAGDLIVAVNGKDVRGRRPARRVVALLRSVRPGDAVRLRVLRGGKTRDFTVTAQPFGGGFVFARRFAHLPHLPALKALADWDGPEIIRGPVADMELARLTPALGRYFGAETGVLVVRAPPGGALGLQGGDVILSIGGRKPIDSSHAIRILASYDPGEKITLQVLRLHRRISIATTMPAAPAMPRRMLMIRGRGLLGPGPVPSLSARDRLL